MADNILWLAGLLEGEGCFHFGLNNGYPHYNIQLVMTDEDVIARAAAVFGAQHTKLKRRTTGDLPIFRVALYGPYALGWMVRLREYMGTRRQAQIDKCLTEWRSRGCRINLKKYERFHGKMSPTLLSLLTGHGLAGGADNVQANPGASGAIFATDENPSDFVHWPFVKIAHGPLNTFNVLADLSGMRLPVKLGDPLPSGANSIGTVVATGILSVTQSGSWTASLGLSLPSGANYLGSVGVTGSVAQAGTWTVQQGGAPWSVSQSGVWTATVGNASGANYIGQVGVTGSVAQAGTWTVQQGGTWTVMHGNPLPSGSNYIGQVGITGSISVTPNPTVFIAGVEPTATFQVAQVGPFIVTQGGAGVTPWPVTGTLGTGAAGSTPSGANYIGQVGVTGTVAATQSGTWTTMHGNPLPSGANYIGLAGVTGLVGQTGTWTVMHGNPLPSGANYIGSVGVTGTVAAAQSGTWTVQQGTPPWSVSQSGVWTGVSQGASGTAYLGQVGVTGTAAVTQSGTWTTMHGNPLPSGANYIGVVGVTGSVAQSGTWTVMLGNIIPSGANYIGSVGVTGLVGQSGTWTTMVGNPLPSGANYIGLVGITGGPVDVRRGITLQFAAVTIGATGDNGIVAADATRKIKVVSYSTVADGQVAARWLSGSSPTSLSGAMQYVTGSGVAIVGQPGSWLMETAVNATLILNLSAAIGVKGHLSYFLET